MEESVESMCDKGKSRLYVYYGEPIFSFAKASEILGKGERVVGVDIEYNINDFIFNLTQDRIALLKELSEGNDSIPFNVFRPICAMEGKIGNHMPALNGGNLYWYIRDEMSPKTDEIDDGAFTQWASMYNMSSFDKGDDFLYCGRIIRMKEAKERSNAMTDVFVVHDDICRNSLELSRTTTKKKFVNLLKYLKKNDQSIVELCSDMRKFRNGERIDLEEGDYFIISKGGLDENGDCFPKE